MAWTIEDLEALDRAIASGTSSVRHGDTSVNYQTTAAMLEARAKIVDELNKQGALPAASRQYFGRTLARYNSGIR